MNYKIKLFFVNCILLSCLSLIIIKAIPNYFYNSKQETISFFDQDEYEQEWLLSQPKLIRHDLYAIADKDIPKTIESFNINGIWMNGFYDSPRYNRSGSKFLNWYLKDPPKNLLGVYFKPRKNPFHTGYPYGDYKYTLDDLLKQEIFIEETYIFWETKQEPTSQKTIIPYKDITKYEWFKNFDNYNKRKH
jgi:hypothetical protein